MNDFAKTLCDWYVGEMGGDAYFTRLAEHADATAERDKWRLLAALEQATAARLLDALTERGIAPPDFDAYVTAAAGRAEPRPGVTWRQQMLEMKPRLEQYVAQFQTARDQAPPDGSVIAGDYLAHEQALLDFVVDEIDGRDGSPVVQRLLQAWRATQRPGGDS